MPKLILIFLFSAQIFAVEGFATYYTEKSCKREGTSGVWTASGEKFDETALTCAMRSREWGAIYEVTNLENGKSVLVRLNDFGPGVGPTARGVIIDLTPAGMKALDAKGRIKVKVVKIREPTKKKK